MSREHILYVHKPVLSGQTLTCSYSFKSEVFSNRYVFPKKLPDTSSTSIQKLCDWMAVVSCLGMFSVEYFDSLSIDFELSRPEVEFFEKLFFFGLGEFRYVNRLPINKRTRILGDHAPGAKIIKKHITTPAIRPLLLNGGGKDGSASALLLSQSEVDFTWFQRGNTVSQANVTAEWQAPVLVVQRQLDEKRKNRKYKGHRPMSAGIAFLSILTALFYGYDAVIASNELSANEGNFTLDGFDINHQYSKSLEFEQDIQGLLTLFGIEAEYFSLLRPLHELQIALIVSHLKPNQLGAITSCNHGTGTGIWCMACAKCAFVVLTISAASSLAAEQIWGKGAINAPGLLPYLLELLDPKANKPFECVGTLEECQLAAYMIIQNKKIALAPATKELLERFASNEHSSLLLDLGESAIPARYQNIQDLMKKYLGEHRPLV